MYIIIDGGVEHTSHTNRKILSRSNTPAHFSIIFTSSVRRLKTTVENPPAEAFKNYGRFELGNVTRNMSGLDVRLKFL